MSQAVEVRKTILNLIQRVYQREFVPELDSEMKRLSLICGILPPQESEEYKQVFYAAKNFNDLKGGIKCLTEIYGSDFKSLCVEDDKTISSVYHQLQKRVLANGHYREEIKDKTTRQDTLYALAIA